MLFNCLKIEYPDNNIWVTGYHLQTTSGWSDLFKFLMTFYFHNFI